MKDELRDSMMKNEGMNETKKNMFMLKFGRTTEKRRRIRLEAAKWRSESSVFRWLRNCLVHCFTCESDH